MTGWRLPVLLAAGSLLAFAAAFLAVFLGAPPHKPRWMRGGNSTVKGAKKWR